MYKFIIQSIMQCIFCLPGHFKVTLVVSSMYLLMAMQLLVLPLTCKLSHDELNTLYCTKFK